MFKVAKPTSGRVPELITISMAYGLVEKGVAVQLDGTLADAPDDEVAGICISNHSGDEDFAPEFPLGGSSVDALEFLLISRLLSKPTLIPFRQVLSLGTTAISIPTGLALWSMLPAMEISG